MARKKATRKVKRRVKQGTRRRRRVRFNLKGGAGATGAPSPFFQVAYAITMPEFPERFQRIKAHATAAGVPLQPFPGVRITPQERDKLPLMGVGTTHYKDRTGATFNLGVIGAFLAHRNLMEHIARTGARPGGALGTAVFEDDVVIPPDFYAKLAAVAPEVPADWDILFLDKFRQEGRMISPHIMKLERDMTAMKNWGIWAFIVRNRSVAQKILPTMEHMLDVPDIQLNKFAHKINMYLIQPGIVKPDEVTASKSAVTQLDQQRGGAATAAAAGQAVKVFVYANLHKPTFQVLYDSLRRGGYEVKILGQGQPWRGFKERMRAYQAAAAAEPADRLIAFLDGYDSVAILPAAVAAQKFLSRPRAAAAPILFSAEPVCLANCSKEQLAWHDAHKTSAGSKAQLESSFAPIQGHPDGSVRASKPVFLNAGGVMGRAGPLAALYAAALALAAAGEEDDQRALGRVIAAQPRSVDLDVEGTVFRTKLDPRGRQPDEGRPTGPAFLHFPAMYSDEEQKELLRLVGQYVKPQ